MSNNSFYCTCLRCLLLQVSYTDTSSCFHSKFFYCHVSSVRLTSHRAVWDTLWTCIRLRQDDLICALQKNKISFRNKAFWLKCCQICLAAKVLGLAASSFLGWTKIEAIDSLMRKAGYNGVITESLRKCIRLTRYQSTLFTMHYGEYVSYVKTIRGSTPCVVGAKA